MKTDQSYTDNNFTVLRLVLALMVAMSGLLLRWTKRQGWW